MRRSALLFLGALAVFLPARVHQVGDSHYSLLLSQHLLARGSFALDDYFRPPLDPQRTPGLREDGLPYQILRHEGHLYYAFPPGSSLLSLPFVAVVNAAGYSLVGVNGRYDPRAERLFERVLAALLMAAFVLVVERSARRLLPPGPSLLVAAAVGLGTQVWSTASRALWSHSWTLLLLGLALDHLLSAARGGKLRPLWLGSLLAWAYVTRPTAAIPALAIAIYLAVRHRRGLPAYLAAGASWAALFVGHSLSTFGTLLPFYFQPTRLSTASWAEALAGNLISPSRGLLVFLPQLLILFYLLVRYRRQQSERALLWLVGGVLAVHWLVISAFPHWWAGHSYGPRLWSEVVPFLALAGILGLAAWRASRATGEVPPRRYRLEAAIGALLLAIAVGIHGAGALSKAGGRWNQYPQDVDVAPARLWDWSDPQFLAWMGGERERHPPAPLR